MEDKYDMIKTGKCWSEILPLNKILKHVMIYDQTEGLMQKQQQGNYETIRCFHLYYPGLTPGHAKYELVDSAHTLIFPDCMKS